MSDLQLTAWVAFSNETELGWLKGLRRGFRHCFVLMNDGHYWMSYDPLASYSEITVHHVPPSFDLPRWLEGRGHAVVKAPLCRDKRVAVPGIYSCVEAVKRVLGLRRPFIFTPWQLYCHLKHLQEKNHGKSDFQTQSPETAGTASGVHPATCLWADNKPFHAGLRAAS